MGANVSTAACCNKGDSASIPSETIRAADAENPPPADPNAENPPADPDAKPSEADGEVATIEVDEEILRGISVHKTLRGLGRDVTCIHQEDHALMERGVYGLGGFLARSKKLLILWSPPHLGQKRATGCDRYLSRLWCVFEIAAYRAANPEGQIELAPLFVELTVLVLWAMLFCCACLAYPVSFTKYFWIAMPFALFPQLVAAHVLRRLISQKHRLIESMANFDVDKAECREEFDRKFVMTVPWHFAVMIDVTNC
eukprot:Skav220329  [mRNA]  locus=scaffold6510:2947:6258:- [translate_table: standard]